MNRREVSDHSGFNMSSFESIMASILSVTSPALIPTHLSV